MQKTLASISFMDNFFEKNKVEFFDATNFDGFVHKEIDRDESAQTKSRYIVDIGKVFEALMFWEKMFENVELIYKASSNIDELVIKLLNEHKVKFSASSGVEIERMIEMGVNPINIYFCGLCKINKHLKLSSDMGVKMLSFGCENELRRFSIYHKDAVCCMRISKFEKDGSFDIDRITCLLGVAASLGIKVAGIEIDIEDLNCEKSYSSAYDELVGLISNVIIFHPSLEYVNIRSKTFFTKYNFDDDEIEQLAIIFKGLRQNFPGLKFYAEAGDILLNSGTQLLCQVTGIKSFDLDESGSKEMYYYLNDGVYGSFSSTLYTSFSPKPIIVKRKCADNECSETSDAQLWGPTCDSIDKICSVKGFPILQVGDVIGFDVMGANCRACATKFNGFTLPDVVYAVSYQCLDHLGLGNHYSVHNK